MELLPANQWIAAATYAMTSKTVKWSVVIVVGVAMIAILAAYLAIHSNPRRTFEDLVVKPVPGSVSSIQAGGFRAMDGVVRVLRFNIDPGDLRKILDSQAYKAVGESELKGWDAHAGKTITLSTKDYLKHWEQRIGHVAKLEVHIGDDWLAYTIKEPPNGQKYIFCNTNLTEAVFVADAH